MGWEATASLPPPPQSRRSYPRTRVSHICTESFLAHQSWSVSNVCHFVLLTAITDYIRVARRKRASVGTARSKRKVKIDLATSELDSQLMVRVLHLVSSAFSKLFKVEVDITGMRQFIHKVVLIPGCVRKACTKQKLSWIVHKLLEASYSTSQKKCTVFTLRSSVITSVQRRSVDTETQWSPIVL